MVSMRPRETSPCWGMGGDEGKLGLPGSTQGLPVEAEARPLVAEASWILSLWGLEHQPQRHTLPLPPLNPGGRKERAEVLNQESPLKTLVSETRALMRGRRRLPYLGKQLSLSLPPMFWPTLQPIGVCHIFIPMDSFIWGIYEPWGQMGTKWVEYEKSLNQLIISTHVCTIQPYPTIHH